MLPSSGLHTGHSAQKDHDRSIAKIGWSSLIVIVVVAVAAVAVPIVISLSSPSTHQAPAVSESGTLVSPR